MRAVPPEKCTREADTVAMHSFPGDDERHCLLHFLPAAFQLQLWKTYRLGPYWHSLDNCHAVLVLTNPRPFSFSVCQPTHPDCEQVHQVAAPHPDWTPGTEQPIPYAGTYKSVDPEVIGGPACYPLVISAVTPRPIGFVSSISANGAVNLAPFSYFGAMSHDPPLVRAQAHVK